jgi:hypothetical protein
MRAELERVEIPGAAEAEARAAAVVTRAYAERQPVTRRRSSARPLVAVAVAVALIAAVLSPPGRAFVERVRRAVGIEGAKPALFSLPAPGRLLVSSDAGVWIAQPDGSRRLLGPYEEGSWSPLGRYVVATRANELVTLDGEGHVRWTLARPGVRFPRWSGSATDTRIAYLSSGRLRVVAGDGTNDAAVGDAPPVDVAPAWRTGPGFVLAYADGRPAVEALLLAKGGKLWEQPQPAPARSLEFSNDGTRLLALLDGRIRIIDADRGTPLAGAPAPDVTAVAYQPGTEDFAELHVSKLGSRVTLGGRVLFSFGGELRGLTWSPDGHWLLVGVPASDQWVFLRADGTRIVAVSNVSEQFHSRSFPRVEGWCCA